MLRNRLFAMASFASLVVAGGVASAPAAFADELSLDQEAAPVALDSNANIPGYQSMNYPADNPPVQSEQVPPVREEIPAGPSVVPSFPSMVPSVPSEVTPPLPALVPPTSSTTTFPTPLVAGMTETPQDPMNPAESGASLLTPLVAGVTESPHAPGSANQPVAVQMSTPAAPVLAGTDSSAPALARTGQAAQTVSLVAGLTAFAGAWLLVLARRRHEN
ncbi:LPXTG cell wall anchor domain-containing protein [uncultured Mobiluncus sp.]|uniref:LPXTG cell wall anchor domain-containing protein n=1 Tax=uncultured Mobiluncus sp. TaxID=293425 RepID=UPI0028048EF6|nr:LPXTG cell wall anchor domain-containing protein [uncultured Mobiluncus sp.]